MMSASAAYSFTKQIEASCSAAGFIGSGTTIFRIALYDFGQVNRAADG
jgi:hypothetical protein